MKILLTTLNAKYIHVAMALYTLQSYVKEHGFETKVREFTINQEIQWILGQILRESPDLVAISCNIWNIEAIHILCRRLKAVQPEILIVLGGPEVDPDPVHVLQSTRADFGIIGEGEKPMFGLLKALTGVGSLHLVPGLVWRDGETFMVNVVEKPIGLEEIPFPYPDHVLKEPGRIFYYETSRGCPFSCAYCLSGSDKGMRYLPLERVFVDLDRLVNAQIRQVKFVDRTFNTEPKRTAEILRYIIERYGAQSTNFHLELVAEILSEETMELLASAPEGLFRVEVGIQSLHPPTLAAIGRKNNPDKLERNLRRLMAPGNVPVHLDLIAGLPEEGMNEFAGTLDWTYRLEPEELQLGILKLLKGSTLGRQAQTLGYIASEEAPYEVLITPWLTFSELDRLKTIAHLMDLYHNSGHFKHTLTYLCQYGDRSPFACFHRLAERWECCAMDAASHGLRELFLFLHDALDELLSERAEVDVAVELLRLDRALADWGFGEEEDWGVPSALPDTLRDALTDNRWIEENMPELANFAPNDRRRRVRHWCFKVDPRSFGVGDKLTEILVYRPVRGRIKYRYWSDVSN